MFLVFYSLLVLNLSKCMCRVAPETSLVLFWQQFEINEIAQIEINELDNPQLVVYVFLNFILSQYNDVYFCGKCCYSKHVQRSFRKILVLME